MNQHAPGWMIDRRQFILAAGIAGGALLASCKKEDSSGDRAQAPTSAPTTSATQPVATEREMVQMGEKAPLIMLTDRPPQLETPLKYFESDLTPNEAFFVRWHLATIPLSVDLATFKLNIRGHVEHELNLSVDELKSQFEAVSVVAVNQCSGNSRSLFEPRVPGGQWGHGAVGNARWTGVRLRDLLKKAGVKDRAVELSFQGLDRPVIPQTPAFIKALGMARANHPDTIVAYAMNDQPLPILNGFPIRLVVPGWYATYWMKALNDINVLAEPFKGFWMDKAYRVSKDPHARETPDKLAADTVPISAMTTRSLIIKPEDGQQVAKSNAVEVQGVAFDDGSGIEKVEVSTDGGKTWTPAKLDPDLGNYSWRRWRFQWTPGTAGKTRIMARATNAKGMTQETEQWNRSGYARDVIEHIDVTVA